MGTYNYYKMFGCFNRKFKISETEAPPDVKAVFYRYVEKGTAKMSADQFLRFLIENQREKGVNLGDAERIMNEVHQRRHHLNLPISRHSHHDFTLEEFFYYLFQDDFNPPIGTQVHHDMTAPLQHYFIYTGHNSYLTGNQLSSDSSEIPIIRALQRGVRGIELDLWPNAAKDNIHVLHGRTLTTPILLSNCLKSIKEHAFVKSPYPVIITLEDHLTPELQAKVAEMVIQIFGNMLYYPENGFLGILPSPEELKHRIILSTKPPKEYFSEKNNDRETPSPSGKDAYDQDSSEKDTPGDTPKHDFSDKYDHDELDDDDENFDTHSRKSGQSATPEYKRLVAMRGGKPIRGLDLSLSLEIDEVGSRTLGEQLLLEKDAASPGIDPVRFTQKSKMRVFPKGTRITSPKEYPSGKHKDMERTSTLGKNILDEDFSKHKDMERTSTLGKNIPDQDLSNPKDMERTSTLGKGLHDEDFSKHKDMERTSTLGIDLPNVDFSKQKDLERTSTLGKGLRDEDFSKHKDMERTSTLGKGLPNEDFLKCKDMEKTSTLGKDLPNDDFSKHKDMEMTSTLGKDLPGEDFLERDISGDSPDYNLYDKCDNDDDDDDSDTQSQKYCQLGAPDYKRLIAIHAAKPNRGLKESLNPLTDQVGRLSLSEHLLEKAAASHGTDLVRFTQNNILRVFPKGTRVTSSNFKPLTGWMHGAQMVAFNMQGYGKSLWLMHGMFRANGGCGYVKKPHILMTSGPQGEVFDLKTPLPVTNTLKVNLYLGDGWRLDFSHTHFDSYSPPDFYTKVSIVGVPEDVAKKQTRIIEDDWGPTWDQEFKFPLTVPDLALLQIEVREHDMSDKDDFGGQTCLPVLELRPGIRAVSLYDKKGDKLRSVRLLMRFQFV